LNSFEEKIKSVQSADFSQYVGPHGSLPGTSAADAKNVAAVNLQHEQRTGTASASINAAVRSDQSEGRTCNALSSLPYVDSMFIVIVMASTVNTAVEIFYTLAMTFYHGT